MKQSKRLRASFLVSTALITDNGGIILLMQSRSAVRDFADEELRSDVKIQWPRNPQIINEEPYIVYFDYTQGQC